MAISDFKLFAMHATSLHLVVLIGLLLMATAVDVREHRIPNKLIVIGIAVGMGFHVLASGESGIIFAVFGALAGMGFLLPMYIARVMGAGDVKLMGMIGAFLGSAGVTGAALATMAAGGALALVLVAYKRMLPQLLSNLRIIFIQFHMKQMGVAATDPTPIPHSVGKMPYAVAILAGTLIQIFVLRY